MESDIYTLEYGNSYPAALNKSGRDEQATLVTVGGIIVVMLMLIGELGELISSIRSVFGL